MQQRDDFVWNSTLQYNQWNFPVQPRTILSVAVAQVKQFTAARQDDPWGSLDLEEFSPSPPADASAPRKQAPTVEVEVASCV